MQELNARLTIGRASVPARRARAERVPDLPHPGLDADSARARSARASTRSPQAAAGREILVHCKMGGRSAKAVRLLRENGIEAENVKGGILDWIDRVDPSLPKT